ncbi:MAG: flagellar protein [Spirochaetales bacterium]|nr:flagellar protein [Spirochaetales bacterium]
MKKLLIMLMILSITGVMGAIAEEITEPQVLIDFNDLAGTEINYGDVAGAGLKADDKANLKVDLGLKNWEVHLSSSSQVGENVALTYVQPAQSNKEDEGWGKPTVLGVRIHFPEAAFNSYAIIQPPFNIPAYMDKTDENGNVAEADKGLGQKFDNKGVLKNVATIKHVEMMVNGRNFPHGIGIILEDQNAEERIIFVDYLRYTGWKKLIWKNPNYVEDVRNRELRSYPLYPRSQPFIKFKGIIIYRDAANIGGDFVTYVKDIKLGYDQAVTDDFELDINDEALWGIVQQREDRRKTAEIKRLGNLQVLRYLEEKKKYAGPDPAAADAATTTP